MIPPLKKLSDQSIEKLVILVLCFEVEYFRAVQEVAAAEGHEIGEISHSDTSHRYWAAADQMKLANLSPCPKLVSEYIERLWI
jgi:hypothetical protein